MDLASTFSAMPGVTPLDDLPDAWHWSMAPGFDFAAALSQDREHAFQCYALDSYDEDLVAAVLAFARAHGADLIGDRPLVAVDGFAHKASAFDIVVAIGPAVHKYHAKENADVHQVTRAVFPAYRCEFAGDEDDEQTRYRYTRASGVPATRLDREPRPYLRMRHRTDSGREIAERGFAQPKTLVHELRALENRPDRFVEFENFRHEVWRVEWDEIWVVTDGSAQPRRSAFDDLLEFVKASLYGPNLDAGISQFG